MIKTVLLLRMVGFTTLFVALALAILVYQKAPRRWLKFFLIYMGIEAVYSVSFTFVFYSRTYLSENPTTPGMFFVAFQLLSSLGILYSAPRFLQELVLNTRGKAARYGILAVPLFFLAAAFLSLSLEGMTERSGMKLSALFYAYILLFYIWALSKHRNIVSPRWRKGMTVFLAGAVLWHILWALELSVFQMYLSDKGPLPSILLTNALWEVFWALVVLVPAVSEIATQSQGATAYTIPEEFTREYGISKREAEIIPKLCAGESSKNIADALYISPRTVENHIQNIYRKCGVSRRLELMHLLNRYSG